MIQVEFTFPVGERMLKVVAKCREVTETELSGLNITFMDSDDNVIKVDYNAELFEDLEDEALAMLAEVYYNNADTNFLNNYSH